MDLTSLGKPSSTNAFFCLGSPASPTALRGDALPSEYKKLVLGQRGDYLSPHPVIVSRDSGRLGADFMWVSLEPLIRQRVVDLFDFYKITGWSTYPVTVYDKDCPVPGFYGLAITGRCKSINIGKEPANLVYKVNARGKFPYYKGLSITFDSWDGADLFMSSDGKSTFVVVTAKVRDLLINERVSNYEMEPISEVEVAAMDQPVLDP